MIRGVKPARKDAFALDEATIRRTSSSAASLAPCAAYVVTNRMFAIGSTLALDRAMFVRSTIPTKKFIAAAVVVRPATFNGESRTILGLTGRHALATACVAKLADLVAEVGTQAFATIIAAALVRALRCACGFALAGGLVTCRIVDTARGAGAVTAIGATDPVVTSRNTDALTFFPGAPVILAGFHSFQSFRTRARKFSSRFAKFNN